MLRLFLCGDVMTGRGIDQILPHPSDPVLYEPFVKNARDYVELAERAHGPVPRPVGFSYVWGAALEELERASPDIRVINLETAVTRSDDYWKDKAIHYRMHPENAPAIEAARIDCSVLANNHVLDWGYGGLLETLDTLHRAGMKTAGAGRTGEEAEAPAILDVPGKGRVLVLACGAASAGVWPSWEATRSRPGVCFLPNLSEGSADRIGEQVRAVKRENDVAVLSIHWGDNWGYAISSRERAFAHRLIDEAGIDLVHGHSSHHVKGIEVYREKLILYGCGDFLTDYEGITGHESFRDDLGLMYLPGLDPASGRLLEMKMVPTCIRGLRLHRADGADAGWLGDVLNREGHELGTGARSLEDGSLELEWSKD